MKSTRLVIRLIGLGEAHAEGAGALVTLAILAVLAIGLLRM